jgi:hypothetical protein
LSRYNAYAGSASEEGTREALGGDGNGIFADTENVLLRANVEGAMLGLSKNPEMDGAKELAKEGLKENDALARLELRIDAW